MARCLNRIELIGVVTTTPTVIDENPLGVKFKLATFKTFYSKKKQEYVKQTEFHLVKVWNRDAEFVYNRIEKNERLYVEGEMHYYEKTFDDGRMIQKPEVMAKNIIKLSNWKTQEQKNEEEQEKSDDVYKA
ncbi:MAG: single-stranded DNA-binding protein [bacterium]